MNRSTTVARLLVHGGRSLDKLSCRRPIRNQVRHCTTHDYLTLSRLRLLVHKVPRSTSETYGLQGEARLGTPRPLVGLLAIAANLGSELRLRIIELLDSRLPSTSLLLSHWTYPCISHGSQQV